MALGYKGTSSSRRIQLLDRIHGVLVARSEVLDAYLFRSYAREDEQPHSDVHVAVYVSSIPETAFGYAAELSTELMHALQMSRVDVMILNRATPLMYQRVLRDGSRVLARDRVATTGREQQALSCYCESVPHAKSDAIAIARMRAGALGSIDAALVRGHLEALDAALATLRRHQGRPAELLRRDVEEAWIIERGLQLCAQNCLDIAMLLAASAGYDVPDDASAIDSLERMGVLTAEFSRGFRAIAGFQSLVVHGHRSIDSELMYKLLNERLDDFVRFARCVEHALLPTDVD